MKPTKPVAAVWISLLVSLIAVWAGLIYFAIEVTETVLLMLEYVTELAQLY